MKKEIIVLFLIGFISCTPMSSINKKVSENNKKTIITEFFVLPKKIVFGPGTLDIEDYGRVMKNSQEEYFKKSIYTDYDSKKYNCFVKRDSICEYFFVQEAIDQGTIDTLINSLIAIDYEVKFLFSRVLLRFFYSTNNIKELKIDNNYTVYYDNKYFKTDTTIFNSILKKVPIEIKENWIYDLGDIRFEPIK